MDGISRQRFDFVTDTGGDWADTGPPISGAILQVRYIPDGSTPLDTGADITLSLANTGVPVLNMDNIGSAAFTRVPKQPIHDTGGAAVSGLREFVFAVNEGLRVEVNQSAAVAGVKKGTLFVWVG